MRFSSPPWLVIIKKIHRIYIDNNMMNPILRVSRRR